MFKRLAFFEGVVRSGREAEFDAYVNDKLLPLWRRFPNAVRVEVLREVAPEDGSHRYPMVLEIVYPDRAAIAEALASRMRAESREATKRLFEFYELGDPIPVHGFRKKCAGTLMRQSSSPREC
ncbi:MAG TPA: hypothetical protein VJY34_02765 [Roseiarcus sp.]|nr:hypothetical protein [Roseiarcus sp.]